MKERKITIDVRPDQLADVIEAVNAYADDLKNDRAHLHFSQWQAAFNQLTQAVSRIEDEDKVGKLCAAIRAQLAAWGKAMEGTP